MINHTAALGVFLNEELQNSELSPSSLRQLSVVDNSTPLAHQSLRQRPRPRPQTTGLEEGKGLPDA